MTDNFWNRVTLGDGCWEWTGVRQRRGYGKAGSQLAHRVAYELSTGPIPAGMFVLHRCDNPPCVRPDHLWLGTQKDNMEDMASKGRHVSAAPAGESHWNAKLNASDVEQIRTRAATGRETQRAIAREYGVSYASVSLIVNHQTWRKPR